MSDALALLATLRWAAPAADAAPRWRRLPPEMRALAEETILLTAVSDARWPEPCRVAQIPDPRVPGTYSDIPDLAWVSAYSHAHDRFRCRHPDPDYHRWRTRQVLANYPLLDWHLPRGELRGRALHVVGYGPSARDAVAHIPARAARRSRVLALNRAIQLPGLEPDYWFVVDALRPGNVWEPRSWLERLAAEGTAARIRSARAVLAIHASHALARACVRPSFYLPAADEHRDLVRADVAATLPTFVVATQGLVGALHLAWWLGADPIVLWGCDQGLPRGAAGYYADGGPSGAPDEWIEVPGARGLPVRTTRGHALCALQAAAALMWIADAGARAWNASRGLDYGFAPGFPPEYAAKAAEEMSDP